jgi:predicted metal-dependent enzyme (double-stranded beta helix superfamily)
MHRKVPFDVDQLVEDCLRARAESEPRRAVKELIERTVAGSDTVADALQPTEGGLSVLHGSSELTVLHVVWAPGMRLFPHNHLMWAVIGIYTGQEDNAFYRRAAPQARTLTDSGGKQLSVGDVLTLGDDVIHSVTNPLAKLTGAIHVYGGDFFNEPRSQWGPGPVEERPYNPADVVQEFADANRAWWESVNER